MRKLYLKDNPIESQKQFWRKMPLFEKSSSFQAVRSSTKFKFTYLSSNLHFDVKIMIKEFVMSDY